jgi:hypothetical protein
MKTNMSLLVVALLTVSGSLLAQPAARFHTNSPKADARPSARIAVKVQRQPQARTTRMGAFSASSFNAAALSPERSAFAQTERLVKALDLTDKQALKVLKIHRSYAGKPFDEGLTKDIASVLKGYQKEKYTYLCTKQTNRRDNPRHLNGRGFNRNSARAFSDARQGQRRQSIQQGNGAGKQMKQRNGKGLQNQGQQPIGMGKRG